MTTSLARITGTTAGRPPGLSGRPVSGWAFTGLAVTSAGGPLALAALSAPAMVAEASASAGLPAERGYQPVLEIAIPVVLAGVMIAGRRAALLAAGGLAAAWLATAVLVVLAAAPLAADPALAQAGIPGMTAAELFAGHSFGVTVGIAVAVSIAGVMLAEDLALSRLVTALTAWRG